MQVVGTACWNQYMRVSRRVGLELGLGGFSIVGNTITLETIGGGQPSEMILPSGASYPDADASITTGKFSPYVDGPAIFTLHLTGVTTAVGLPGLILASGGLLGWWQRRQKGARPSGAIRTRRLRH